MNKWKIYLVLIFHNLIYLSIFRSLHAAYDMDIEQIKKTSQSARDLITSLLRTGPSSRLSAEECLKHVWLRGGRLEHQPTLVELETKWMKQCLARRRWHRAFNAIQVGSDGMVVGSILNVNFDHLPGTENNEKIELSGIQK